MLDLVMREKRADLVNLTISEENFDLLKTAPDGGGGINLGQIQTRDALEICFEVMNDIHFLHVVRGGDGSNVFDGQAICLADTRFLGTTDDPDMLTHIILGGSLSNWGRPQYDNSYSHFGVLWVREWPMYAIVGKNLDVIIKRHKVKQIKHWRPKVVESA